MFLPVIRLFTIFLLRLGMTFHVLDRHKAECAVEGYRGNKTFVDRMLNLFGKLGRSGLFQYRQTKLVEFHSGQIQVIGATHLFFTIDAILILTRIFLQTFSGFRQQIFPLAEHDRAGRAGFCAGRDTT